MSSVRAGGIRYDTIYRSQMLSLGVVRNLTGSKQEGHGTCQMMMKLGYQKAVELMVKNSPKLIIQAGVVAIIGGSGRKNAGVLRFCNYQNLSPALCFISAAYFGQILPTKSKFIPVQKRLPHGHTS